MEYSPLFLTCRLSLRNSARPGKLRVIFEVNKVHINDKTSQSSEDGGKDRQQTDTESSTQRAEG